ncbi:MAG: SDR family oxidoreductase [Verrucomicrobiae bacterium]|nr:SDR family oxidoreductase [Verrucomicrobiae bacterium]
MMRTQGVPGMAGRKRVLIIGCGYVGLELGRRLASQGHTVFGLRRTAEGAGVMTEAGIHPLVADITRPETLAPLPAPFDWVVHCVSSSRQGAETYRAVYLEGMRHVLDWLAAQSHPPEAFAYTSSTSVYGQTSGDWVDEDSPTQPGTETGETLVATEGLVLEAARSGRVPGRILRVAGIYGPGRGHLFHQFLAGEARIQGDGSRWINMIHRDDVASALEAALERGAAGEVYNAVDDEPVSQRDFLAWLAERLGRPMPPAASWDEAVRRKRGLTHKRVRNRKLRAVTGWAPAYPTYREGYAGAVAEVLAAGAQPVAAS